MAALRPFFTYYGGKYRAAPIYPAPRHSAIVEPFAGSAGYAMRHADHDVILVERDPKIAAVWRYLLSASPDDVAALPLWGDGWQTTDDLDGMDLGAQSLIGLWLNSGTAQPRKTPSKNMRVQRRPNGYWGEYVRERIASQVDAIRHWRLIEGDYSEAPDIEATWFVDPPYQVAGSHYKFGSSAIDYAAVATWARRRRGQVLVCEAAGADWLPFRPLATILAGNGKGRAGVSHEVLWAHVDEGSYPRPLGDAINDPRVPCCGRDAADCDCPA